MAEQSQSRSDACEQALDKWAATLKGPGYMRDAADGFRAGWLAAVSEQQEPSVAVKDMEIIGHREPGDEHKGRAWWSGGTWLRGREVVAVLELPAER